MHTCPECGMACDCDGEDTWIDSHAADCTHECEEEEDLGDWPDDDPFLHYGDNRMNTNDYQRLAGRTLIDGPDTDYTDAEIMLVWNALGLAGEAGEVADTIKKAVFHRHPFDRDEVIKELGDVLWYVAALCSKLDVPMSEVMERNIAKLIKRYPDGYSSAASKVRADFGR